MFNDRIIAIPASARHLKLINIILAQIEWQIKIEPEINCYQIRVQVMQVDLYQGEDIIMILIVKVKKLLKNGAKRLIYLIWGNRVRGNLNIVN